MENCPDCGAHRSGGWTRCTLEVIELPVVPVQVTEHVYIARTCPACRRRCTPPAELDGVVLGQQRRGVNLLSLIATLREEGRRPIRSVQWYLDTVHQLRLSVGAIHRTAQRAQPAVAAILDRIRASPVVHADQTGWRQSVANGYVWTFSTPTERYCPCSSQGQALLRDIHDQRTLYPDAAPLARWADAVHGIYDRAKAFTHSQAKLCRRIERHIKSLTRTGYGELFVFVAEPEVPSDNNAAELSLRHLVVRRKVSGGTGSEQGTESKMTLASIFGTWRAQGLNPLAACRQLLTSPLL